MGMKFNPVSGQFDMVGEAGGTGPAGEGVPTGGTTDQILKKASGTDYDTAWADFAAFIPGPNSTLVLKDDTGAIITLSSWQYDATYKGARWNHGVDAPDDGGGQLHTWNAQFNPTENAPDASWQFRQTFLEIDTGSSGFNFGTNAGTALAAHVATIKHFGTSDVGSLALFSGQFELGNGTDPIDVKGFSYSYGFANIANAVNISGPIQGYGVQPGIAAGASVSASNVYFQAFYDASNVACDWLGSWNSFNASPSLSKISNNSNYAAFNANPTITDIDDNCGVNVLALGGNYGTFGTNAYFNGINVNPTISSGNNVTLLGLYTNNVTASGNVKALDAVGDCSITGDLQVSGSFAFSGVLNLFSPYTLISNASPGQVGSLFSFVSGPTCAANSTLTNADFLGVNTASLIDIGDNSNVTTFLTGISALGLPAVAKIGAGATVDRVAGATFALSLDAASGAGGVINSVHLGQALAIPNGITQVDRIVGWFADLPFGAVGTLQYGLYATSAFGLNWVGGKFKIGGGDTPTTADCALEVSGGAIVLPLMDTITRDAMTPTAGMIVFNTDTPSVDVYDGSNWVSL